AVLGAVVDTNFGTSSHERIRELYSAISEVQEGFTNDLSSLAHIHFARAFAVVMEESVRQLQQVQQPIRSCSCNSIKDAVQPAPCDPPATAEHCSAASTPNEGMLIDYCPSDTVSIDTVSTATVSRTSTPAPGTSNLSSPAFPGAVVVNQIDPNANRHDLIKFLQKVGPLTDLAFPLYDGRPNAYACGRYKSKESAMRATCELHGARLKGRAVYVHHASYWIERESDRVSEEEQRRDVSETAPHQPHHSTT
ncbi:hypothetical protein PFISCL1PPCAC_21357, partial [Pristionchus fissidentatus]